MIGRSRAIDLLQFGFPVGVFWFGLDQLSKGFIRDSVTEAVPITGFFNIVLVHNTGVSFGFAQGAPIWIFPIMAALIALAVLRWPPNLNGRLAAVSLGHILGGAAGNFADRLARGAVTDFLDFHVGTWHWPSFNFADVAITVGAALLLFGGILTARRTTPHE